MSISNLLCYCQKIKKSAIQHNLEKYDVFGCYSETLSVDVFNSEITKAENIIDETIYLRAELKGKVAEIQTSISPEVSTDELIEKIKNLADIKTKKENLNLCPVSQSYQGVKFYSEQINFLDLDNVINQVIQFEKIIKNINSCVSQCDICNMTIAKEVVIIENSLGVLQQAENSVGLFTCDVICEDANNIASNYGIWGFREINLLDFRMFANRLVDEAIKMLGASTVKSNKYKIILSNTAMCELMEGFCSIFYADKILDDSSVLKIENLDCQLFSDQITIVDDPFNGFNIKAFDDEGVATSKLVIVENGILKKFLLNLETASKIRQKSTGNAVRYDGGIVGIGASNLYIENGPYDLGKIYRMMNNGIEITEFFDIYSGMDIYTGDFSCACKGFLINEGKVDKPVTDLIVSGNFLNLLKNVVAVGNDMHLSISQGCFGSPSLYVGQLDVVGG